MDKLGGREKLQERLTAIKQILGTTVRRPHGTR